LTAALTRVGAQGGAASKRADGEEQLASIVRAKTSMSNRRETTQFRWGTIFRKRITHCLDSDLELQAHEKAVNNRS
jgi:hypothetical protein